MPKGIKKTAKILVTAVSIVCIVLSATPILLQNSKIQNLIAQTVVGSLSKTLQTKVSVGQISYLLFDRIHIKDIYVEDQQKDTLLYVKDADAAFHFWKFYNGKVIFKGLEFKRLYGNLKIDSTGATNLDFIIKALQKPQKNDSSNVEYRIKYFKLTDSSFRLRNVDKNQTLKPGLLNGDNIFLTDINADVRLNVLNNDSLNLELRKLSFNERSGFTLKNLTTAIAGSKHGARIPYIDLRLPESKLFLDKIELRYDSIADLKQFATRVKWNAPFKDSYISLPDLACLAPELKNLPGKASIDGVISGRLSGLQFQQMKITYGHSLVLDADMDISGLPNLNEAFFYGQINRLEVDKPDIQDVVSVLTHKPFVLSNELGKLGKIRYKGNITGFLSNLVVYGNLQTNLGSISSDILLKFENQLRDLTYSGSLKTNGFQIGEMLNSRELGSVALSLKTNGTKLFEKALKGKITATVDQVDFNKYLYKDIQFAGDYDGTGFKGDIDVKDDNVNACFTGVIDLTKKLPVFDFDLKLAKSNLYALNLIKGYKNSDLSLHVKTSMTGNSPDNMNGFIKVDSIRFTNKDKTLNAGEIMFISRTEKDYSNFSIASDYVNGAFSGNFRYSTIGYTVSNILKTYLPSISAFIGKPKEQQPNEMLVDITVDHTNEIADVLELPYHLEGKATIKGVINETLNKVDIKGNIPLLKSGVLKVENISLLVENAKQKLQLTARAQVPDKGGLISMYLISKAAKDSIATNIGWQNVQSVTNAGEINTVAKFFDNNGKTEARLQIFPTQVIIADSVWEVKPSTVDLKSDSTIHINNFKFAHNDQFIYIHGVASKSDRDSLTVKTNDVDVDFIMNLLKLKGVSIGGMVTGQIKVFSLLNKPYYAANLFAKNFSLNNKRIGDGTVSSTWDDVNRHVLLSGMFMDGVDTVALAKGFYVPKEDSIELNIDARKFSVEFLSRYFEGVVENLKGYGSGHVQMFGPMKTIGFKGDILAHNVAAKFPMLQTTYFFTDSIHLKHKSIEMTNIKVYDEERNQGILNGRIVHDGMFTNMNYDVNIKGKNILALNTRAENNDYFFGKAYVTGTVRITGTDKEANIVATGTTQPKSKCYIQMGGASKVAENDFIVFLNPVTRIEKPVAKAKVPGVDFNTKVDLQIDVTNDAEMELIVDPKGGDIITGRGTGNLRVQFDTFSDIFLYGNYTLNTGYYLFTLQTLIRKEFKIQNGSTLSWTGDPFGAKVDINAIYPLTASLKDLMDPAELESTTSRTSVPVNCVLKLTDDLMKPTIKFEIDLPQSDEATKQKVNSIVNTEEMMNRQIAYLLVVNKFYTPDYLRTTTTGGNNVSSFVASTLSAHISNWVKQAFNTNSLSFGVDWQTSEITQQNEFKAQVLYQPNNRLILNGNLGYSTENTSTSNNRFIGDIDLEYLLSESGKLRFKAYNHTIDRLGEAKLSQGVGLVYKEDFVSVGDMINYYFGWVKGSATKKQE